MSGTQQLPPMGHVHFPVPRFEKDLFPLSEVEDTRTGKVDHLKWQTPRSARRIALACDSGTHLPYVPGKHHVSAHFQSDPLKDATPSKFQSTQSTSRKVEFNFVEVHGSSGKLSSSTSSHVRSVVMRKHHEQRRKLQRPAKSQVRSLVPSCNHSNGWSTMDLQPDIEGKHLPGQNETRQHRTYRSSSTNLKTVTATVIACTQCGQVQEQVPAIHREANLINRVAKLQTLLEDNFGDPFDSAEIALAPRTRELAHRYFFEQASATNPHIYDKNNVYQGMITSTSVIFDAPCIYSMACLAASVQLQFKLKVIRPASSGMSDDINRCTSEANRFLALAAKQLNKKLQDPKTALTGESIMAACLIGICSEIIGQESHCDATYRGVLRMIQFRGGLDMLPRTVAYQVSRIYQNMSFMRQSKLELPMYRSRFRENGPLVSAFEVCSRSAEELFTNDPRKVVPTLSMNPRKYPFPNKCFEEFLSNDLFSTAIELHGLSYMLDLYAAQPSHISELQREFFEDTYAGVQHNLILFPQPTDKDIIMTAEQHRQHSWRLAALMYLNSAIRYTNPISKMGQILLTSLMSALRLSNISQMWTSYPSISMWIVFMGKCLAVKDDEHDFFLRELKLGVGLLELKRSEELEELLQSLLYRKETYSGLLRVIWEEIENDL